MSLKNLGSRLKLRHLNISGNKLTDDALFVLAKGLRTSKPDLKFLDLSHNYMGDYSSLELGEFLDHAESLEILNLSWNRITGIGGQRIFEGLRLGRACRSVNMGYNSLGKQDTFGFVESVQLAINEETIKHLDLSYNRMNRAL